jgi:hypothetical protein
MNIGAQHASQSLPLSAALTFAFHSFDSLFRIFTSRICPPIVHHRFPAVSSKRPALTAATLTVG